MNGHLVAAIKQGGHVSLIEWLIALCVEAGRYAGEIEIKVVKFRNRIDPIQIANSLIFNQRRKRALGDRQHIFFDWLPLRINPAVSYHNQPGLAEGSAGGVAGDKTQDRRSDENLPRHPAVHVKLVVVLAADAHLDPNGSEDTG